MTTWLVPWAGLMLLWLLLVGSFAPAELVVGLVAAAIGATGFHVVHARDDIDPRIRPRHLLVVLRRVPPRAVLDCGLVLGALARRATGRRVRGRIVTQLFDAGDAHDPDAAARRALVVAGVSVAPNSLVVDVERDHLVEHQLVRSGRLSSDRLWPL